MDRFVDFVGQLVGEYGPKQIVFASSIAASGGVAAFLFGGWPLLLQVLLIMTVADFITGIIAGGVEGKLKSKVGLVGIARKVFIFVIVSLAHQADTVLGDQHMLRDATVFFYMANEMLSIVENGGRIGVPIPKVIRQTIEVLKGKGGENDD
ncbi:holin family protein [Paenibacillus sp. MER 180]|uniref:phage holin family protein n=1 Tax=Paenibacillus sp. MER 180 TaxID=2939570 RepID=UPI002040D2F1|nr:holin family protein [Paenibacillus sp. MER 180]MCM3292419.1 holin family protein [Paenibacillus sp. MER 180]